MHPKNPEKLNYRFGDVIRAAFGIAMVDGGFVIAVQIITFLLGYFAGGIQNLNGTTQLAGLTKAAFLVSLISILNLSVIIYRISGLTRGIKYSAVVCYQQALRRWPFLILLYMFGGLLLMSVAIPVLRTLSAAFGISIQENSHLILFFLMSFIPVGVLACIFVVDQNKNPLQAVLATINIIRYKISFNVLLNLSVFYTLPFSLSGLLNSTGIAEYTGLFTSVWFLFCHVLTIVIYASTSITDNVNPNQQKPTKVVII